MKPSITVNIYPVTTQISLPYSNTVLTTALCVITRYRTVDPAFVSNFAAITHHRQAFLILWYKDTHSMLLYETVRPRYGKATVGYIVSKFTLMNTLLASKKCWRVSHHLRRSSSIRHLSELYW